MAATAIHHLNNVCAPLTTIRDFQEQPQPVAWTDRCTAALSATLQTVSVINCFLYFTMSHFDSNSCEKHNLSFQKKKKKMKMSICQFLLLSATTGPIMVCVTIRMTRCSSRPVDIKRRRSDWISSSVCSRQTNPGGHRSTDTHPHCRTEVQTSFRS